MVAVFHSIKAFHVHVTNGGTRYRSLLRQYVTSRKLAGSSPDYVIEFFFSTLPNASGRTVVLGLAQYQKMFLGSRARPADKADNLTAISEPIV
jgi:hypothetical protein